MYGAADIKGHERGAFSFACSAQESRELQGDIKSKEGLQGALGRGYKHDGGMVES